MSKIDVIRAWKDPEYRNNLSEAELGALSANPAGPMELSDGELDVATGGASYNALCLSCNHCTNTYSWEESCQTTF